MSNLDEGFEEVPLDQGFQEVASDPQLDEGFEPIDIQPQRDLASIAQDQPVRSKAYDREISALEALKEKALQGATFNLSDEIQGAGEVLGQTFGVKGLSDRNMDLSLTKPYWLDKDKSAEGIFDETVDKERDILAQAETDQPVASTVGTVAGAITSPGLGTVKALKALKNSGILTKMAASGAIGTGMGGLAGFGESEGTIEERLPQTIEGAKIGGVVGTVLPGLAAGAIGTKNLLKGVTDIPLIKKPLEAMAQGLKGNKLISEVDRKAASSGLADTGSSLVDESLAALKKEGTNIGNIIKKASEEGKTVNLQDSVDNALNLIKKIKEDGTEEAVQYATAVERKLKRALKIEDAADDVYGVAQKDIPEGLIVPKIEEVNLTKIDPVTAKQVKDVMGELLPEAGMSKLTREPAMVAGKVYGEVGEKLSGVSEDLALSNTKYSSGKKALELLNVDPKDLPVEVSNKIRSLISKIENENVTGDNASDLINEALTQIKTLSPEIAEKYSKTLPDAVNRLKLAQEISKGFKTGVIGTLGTLPKVAGNLIGLGANKLKINKMLSTAETFKDALMKSKVVQDIPRVSSITASSKLSKEPYMIQRQVAQAAENADPELLNDQADQIRSKYGNQGEQLATILNNMANKDKDARRALMFSVMQNRAYRKMLGLSDE